MLIYSRKKSSTMPQRKWRLCLRLVLAVATLLLAVCDLRSEEPASESFALLIGIDEYPKLSKSRQLGGCVNDVEMMRRVLQTYAGFSNANITTLINGDATRKNILEQLERLKARVRDCNANGNSAKVVLHFSGHGSQVMDQLRGPLRDEKTFFDQTIVPSDADRTGGENDIRDDTLNAWSRDICEFPDNRMFVVLDCCHSGTGLRGMKRYRRLDRPLAIPVVADFAPIATPSALPPNVAVISACRSDQLEPEYHSGDQSHGLLTFWLCRLAEESSRQASFSLNKLPEFLRWKYLNEADALLPPDPQLETSGRMSFDGLLFVPPNQTQSRAALVQVDSGGASTMMQGRLDGIRANESYDVYSNSGLLQVDKIGVFIAERVGPTATEGTTQFTTDRNDSRLNGTKKFFCEIRGGVEEAKIVFKLSSTNSGNDGSVAAILDSAPDLRNDWVLFQNDDTDADFELLVASNEVHLSRLNGLDKRLVRTGGRAKPTVSLTRNDSFKRRYAKLLRQIMAIRKLQSLVAEGASRRLYSQPDESTTFSVQLQTGAIVAGAYQFRPANIGDSGAAHLKTGNVYVINVQHPKATEQEIYATIVHIDPQLDLAMMCPESFSSADQSQQQIRMPDGLTTRAFICNADAGRERSDPEYREAVSGVHRAIVIVSPQPADLSSVFRFIETEPSGGKSLSRASSSVGSIKIDFQAQSGGKSLSRRSLRKPSADWWDAEIVDWISD